jgi:uncharacterized protein (TIGR03435 family)
VVETFHTPSLILKDLSASNPSNCERQASRGIVVEGNRITITYNSLRLANRVKDYQVAAPAWTAEQKFDITATMTAGSDTAQAPEILQRLLEERFRLRAHTEPKEMTVYALSEAKKGAKVAEVRDGFV